MTTSLLLPIYNFTTCPQAAALVERFGSQDLAKLPESDQVALLAILAIYVQRNLASCTCSVEEAAEQAISEEADNTSDEMPDALEILDGIKVDDAIALIQFLVQEVER